MRMKSWSGSRALVFIGMAAPGLVATVRAAAAALEPGLAVTFASADGKATDTTTAPNAWLFVEAGRSPTPFLPAGKFTATWEGFVEAELRGDFFFQAELNGHLKLELNGAVALDATGAGRASPLSKAATLNKGVNKLKATFTSPAQGDAFARLAWTDRKSTRLNSSHPRLSRMPSSA